MPASSSSSSAPADTVGSETCPVEGWTCVRLAQRPLRYGCLETRLFHITGRLLVLWLRPLCLLIVIRDLSGSFASGGGGVASSRKECHSLRGLLGAEGGCAKNLSEEASIRPMRPFRYSNKHFRSDTGQLRGQGDTTGLTPNIDQYTKKVQGEAQEHRDTSLGLTSAPGECSAGLSRSEAQLRVGS